MFSYRELVLMRWLVHASTCPGHDKKECYATTKEMFEALGMPPLSKYTDEVGGTYHCTSTALRAIHAEMYKQARAEMLNAVARFLSIHGKRDYTMEAHTITVEATLHNKNTGSIVSRAYIREDVGHK